ncbi:uncharacterized protein PFLUO_LOCUS7026 [Penicillium psychrofluorescens]|uniref:uncharacterized protein n=1 Tax=Penicillium psychrofluorescens TaxID=3158075 RepID=UPI003CCCFE5A
MTETPTSAYGDPGATPTVPTAQQLNRSCESCRSLKVRCLPNPATPNQCQRCAKGRKACLFVAPQRRRPRKRTDSRVAQLEKEMRMMRSLLKDRIREESEPESPDGSDGDPADNDDDVPFQDRLPSSSHASGSAGFMDYSPELLNAGHNTGHPYISTRFSPGPEMHQAHDDVVDRGIISLEDAGQLISFYNHELAPFFPLVVLPSNTTATALRHSKPILFLSVISAAAIAIDANLAAVLNREMVRLYAERFFIEGEKSLELVQALLLMIVFYYPPDSPLKLQFYQYTHIASTMALEIGLASKRRVSNKKSDDRKSRYEPYDELLAEQARAVLGCYNLGSTVAMKTRRPNLLQFNDWMAECVKHLEQSPNRIDQHLAVWFELQKITDEAMASFGLDDTSSVSMLTESRVQAVLRWFDKRVEEWRKKIPSEMLNEPMTLEYRATILAMYELGIGEGYREPDAIKNRFYTLPTPDEDGSLQVPLSAIRIDINMKWMHAAHEMLDAVIDCSTDLMRKMPNHMYTRTVMAMTSLLKIHFSVRTGALSEVVTTDTVNVSYYLDALSNKLGEASGGGNYKIPSRWYHVVAVKGRDWFTRVEARYAAQSSNLGHSVVSASPSTESVPGQMSATQDPTVPPVDHLHDPAAMDSFSVPQNMAHMSPGIGNIREGYVAMSGAGMWPADNGARHNAALFQSIPDGYQHPQTTAGLAPFAFDPQRQPQMPGTGMELDGWLPDGSIFGMPPLPEF